MIDVLLIDDYPSIVEGTKVLLEQDGDMKVHEAYPPHKAMEMLASRSFDVMLVDLNMPDCNGIELARHILSLDPSAKILIFAGQDLQPLFNRMAEVGIVGFVPKTAGRDQLATAVRCAVRGETVLPVSLMRQLRRPDHPVPDREGRALPLSELELCILKDIACGKSNREIAGLLHTSQRSLEYMLTDLFQKLQVKSRVEAAIAAKDLGLLDDEGFLLHAR